MKYSTLCIVGCVLLLGAGCASPSSHPDATSLTHTGDVHDEQSQASSGNSQDSRVEYEISSFAKDLEVPRGLALLDNSTMLVTQRNGSILKIEQGEEPILYADIPNTRSHEEAGLMGIALDPEYDTNRYVYVSLARDGHLEVVRYTDNGHTLESEQILVEFLPVARYHAGGAIAFGPDGKLYFSVGDATERTKAQDLQSYHGKLLRMNPDGSIPSDNPFENSLIRSYGHRNIQGIDRTKDGILIASEHGPTAGFDGKAGGDEINLIESGKNYGRPEVSHDDHQEGMVDPLITYTPALAPSGMIVYRGSLFPQWQGKILVAGLGGTRVVVIDPQTGEEEEVIMNKDYGRLRAIAQNEAGEIFVSSSNRDGRGVVEEGDDRIYNITPSQN